jgi:hypothetical protein
MMIETWTGKREFNAEQRERKLTNDSVNELVQGVCSRLNGTTRLDLIDAIRGEEIGPEVNRGGTFLSTRINNWLWKNVGIKYEDKDKDKPDRIKVEVDRLSADMIEYPIYIEIGNQMDWKKGKFGDSHSCFFGGHATSRLYFNSLPNFYVIKVYTKDKKAFGRCLILTDVPEKGCILVFNSYPGHRDKMYLALFASILRDWLMPKAVVTEHKVTNRDGGSWLYLNNHSGLIIHERVIEERQPVEMMLLGKKPDCSAIKGYEGICALCADPKYDWECTTKLEDKHVFCKKCIKQYNTDYHQCFICEKQLTNVHGTGVKELDRLYYEIELDEYYRKLCYSCKNGPEVERYENDEDDN